MMLDPFLLLETQQAQGESPKLLRTRVNGTRVNHGFRPPWTSRVLIPTDFTGTNRSQRIIARDAIGLQCLR